MKKIKTKLRREKRKKRKVKFEKIKKKMNDYNNGDDDIGEVR